MGVLGYEKEKVLLVRHWRDDEDLIVLFHFGGRPATLSLPFPSGAWSLRFDSAERRWDGPGSWLPPMIQGDGGDVPLSLAALSCAVYMRQ
jgi:maltooligosyltrehalose trehalohydrolase